MRTGIPAGYTDQTRTISARLLWTDNRPNFGNVIGEFELGFGGEYNTVLAYDAKYIASIGYLRACLMSDPYGAISLFSCTMAAPTSQRNWVLKHTLTAGQKYSFQQDAAGHAYSVAVTGDGMVLVGCAGQPLYMTTAGVVNTTTFPGGTTSDPGTFPVVAGGTATLYAGYPNTNPDAFQFMELCAIYKTTGTTWPGTIPYESIDNYVQRINKKVRMAVGGDCTVNKRELVFFDNTNLNRIQFFASYKIDAYAAYTMFVRDYGAIEDVLPMDTYDDDDQIRLINVDMLGSKPVVTAKLKRRNGGEYIVYLVGPDLNDPFSPNTFSIGRDMIIDEVDLVREGNLGMNSDLAGMWFHSSGAQFIGWGFRYSANPTAFFGSVVTPTEIDFSRADVSVSTNQPHTLQATLKSGQTQNLKAGDEAVLEVTEDNNTVQVMRFGVDQIYKSVAGSGKQDQIMGSSIGMKKLAQWQNDAALEYLSQERATGELKDLTKFIRKEGLWGTNETGLFLKDLNLRGVLYSAIPASDRGFIRAKFKVENPNHAIEFGVGLHYIEENIKYTQVLNGFPSEVSTTMKSGVFFVLRRASNGAVDPANCGFYYYDSTYMVGDGLLPDIPQPWTLLGGINVNPTFAANSTFELFVYANDGIYNAYYIPTGSIYPAHLAYLDLPRQLNYKRGGMRNEKDNYGRGAIYARNVTTTGKIYAMGSDSTAIGLYGPYEQPSDKYGHEAFPASETVIIDSETIPYTAREVSKTYFGQAGYTYGPVVTSNLMGSGTEVTFASQRGSAGTPGDNYVLQELTGLSGTVYLKAIKLWIKKVGYPEDGVDVMIYRNPRSPEYPLGQRIASSSIPSSKISDQGGYVYAVFNQKFVINNGDCIVLQRAKNPNNPNTASYFRIRTGGPSYTGRLWLFDEYDDSLDEKTNRMDFAVMSTIDAPGGKFAVPFFRTGTQMYNNTTPTFNATADYYNNMGLAVVSGSGAGNTYRIVGSKAQSATIGVAYIDKDPGIQFEEGMTKIALVHALVGLTRTKATSHLDKSKVDVYRATPTSEGLTFNYFSGEVDKSIQDVIDDIAGRAGPVLSKGKTLLNHNFTAGNVIGPVHRKNIIVKLFMTTASTVNLYFRGSSVQTGFHLQIGRDTLKYFDWMGTLQENVTQYLDINGQQFYCYREYCHLKYILVSLQDNFLTVWGNGKMLWSRELCLDDQLFDAGDAFSMQVAAGTGTIYIPEADQRVESFTADVGKSGYQSISELIGNRRIMVRERYDGSLETFLSREEVGTEQTPYLLATSIGNSQSDQFSTRLLIEGGEIAERARIDLVKRKGNLFTIKSIPEVNSVVDAEEFADILLTEEANSEEQRTFSGAYDPCLEAGDIIYVKTPDGTVEKIIADTMSVTVGVSESEAILDMNIAGRKEAE